MNTFSVKSNISSTRLVQLAVEEKESDSDVEVIQDNQSEDLRLLVETEEAVANIVNTGSDNGQNVKVSSQPSTSTSFQPFQGEKEFCHLQTPLFDLTEDNSSESKKDGNLNSTSAVGKKSKIRVTKAETSFRKIFFKENPDISKFRIHCTVCDTHLGTAGYNAQNIKLHSTLRVLVCSPCALNISKSKLRELLTCNWCYTELRSKEASYIQCKACTAVFCQACIERNLGKEIYNELKLSLTWGCFFCESRQIWPHRVIANAVMKHLETLKGSQHLNLIDFMMDYTECCKSKDDASGSSANKPLSTPSITPSSVGTPVPHIGIAMPRCRPPPPLMMMPQQINNFQESSSKLQTILDRSGNMKKVIIQDSNSVQDSLPNLQTIVDENGKMRKIIVQDKSKCTQFATQPSTSVIVQSNHGPLQIDRNVMQQMLLQRNQSVNTDAMKQMVLQGNQSVTLNTGPQVIHNVYPPRRIVLVAQEHKGQQVLMPSAKQYQISERQMPLHQDKNLEVNQIQVLSPEKNLTNGNINQVKILHSGTLINRNSRSVLVNKPKQGIETSNAFRTTNPVRFYNGTPVNNLPQLPSSNTVTKHFNVITSTNPKCPETVSNPSENVGRRLIIQNESLERISRNPNQPTLRKLLTSEYRPQNNNSPGNVNLETINIQEFSEIPENTNIESVVQSQNSLTRHRQNMAVLENALCNERDSNLLLDPLSIVETATDDDDVIFIEDEPNSGEKNDLVINFVDVETNAVEEINISNILKSNKFNKSNPVSTSCQPEGKDTTICEPPLPKIKIKAIEELVDARVIKVAKTSENCFVDVERVESIEPPVFEATCTVSAEGEKSRETVESEKPTETMEYVNISEDQQPINMKSLKQAMDGIQRVLVSVIRSVRSNRSTIKSYTDLNCKPLEAVKHIEKVQNDLKMCTRQLSLIQSNIYEYYKDVPGVLEPFEPENGTEKNNTNSFTAPDSVLEKDNENVIKKEIDYANSVPSTSGAQSNYFDNFTKFLSQRNAKQKSTSSKNKGYELNQSNNTNTHENMPETASNKQKRNSLNQLNNANSYENITFGPQTKRPKLDFDLSNKPNISGSPVVTEDELRERNGKSNFPSSGTIRKSNKHDVSAKTKHNKYIKLLKKHKIRECYVRLYQLDPEFIRIYEVL